eukprot:11163162-Lingulodinium_polyedra.AAC.1
MLPRTARPGGRPGQSRPPPAQGLAGRWARCPAAALHHAPEGASVGDLAAKACEVHAGSGGNRAGREELSVGAT